MFNISKMVPCKTHGIKRGLSTPPPPPPPPLPPFPLSLCVNQIDKRKMQIKKFAFKQ